MAELMTATGKGSIPHSYVREPKAFSNKSMAFDCARGLKGRQSKLLLSYQPLCRRIESPERPKNGGGQEVHRGT